MASRKPKYTFSAVFQITYISGDKAFFRSVAAENFGAAVELLKLIGVSEYSISKLEKLDFNVYYGVK